MNLAFEGPPLSFDDVLNLIFPDPETFKVYGPPELLKDPRLCAGLLFEHYNDRSRRKIINTSRRWPEVEIGWHFDFSPSQYKHWCVAREVIDLLLKERIIQGTPRLGYTDMSELVLSDYGKQVVVTKWFLSKNGTASTMDILMAGGSIEVATGKVSWE